jgi:aspartate/methionine/tyrosine aminotransferase
MSLIVETGGILQDIGINVDHTDILITTGGSEAILFALNSCADPEDEIITPEPFYANYTRICSFGKRENSYGHISYLKTILPYLLFRK